MDLLYCICKTNSKDEQHITGRKIVEYAAKNIYNIQNSELEIINKKPIFKNSNIHFSISHSEKMVIVCFDKFPVGADIEKIKPKDYKAIAKRMNFELQNDSLEDFFTQWTIFEAKYKLQTQAKSTYTTQIGEYKISVASSETTDIQKNINLYDITSFL